MLINLTDIFNIPSAVIYNPDDYKSITSVSIDTRTIKKNSIFVAIKGKNFDGHDYVKKAIELGATAVVINNKKIKDFNDLEGPVITVKNTIHALGKLANIWRNKLNAKVISITGSNGKTSTKEILSHLLSTKYKIHKTEANNNNQIGVPLTILSAPRNTDFIVLEHGTNHFGEIEYTAKIAEPDYAIITNIGNSHTEFLESKDKILFEKAEIFNWLNEDGVAFINIDDEYLKKLKNNYRNVITLGYKGRPVIKGKVNDVNKNEIEIKNRNKKINTLVKIPLLGKSNIENYLSAVSIAMEIGLGKRLIIKATKTLKSVKGRLELIDCGNYSIVNDTYNSNPESVKNALDVLRSYSLRKRKILIFGDMFELGSTSKDTHSSLADYINNIKIDIVITIGKHSAEVYSNLNEKYLTKKHFRNRKSLKRFLEELDIEDSTILVKGSRGMKMEEFVNILENREN